VLVGGLVLLVLGLAVLRWADRVFTAPPWNRPLAFAYPTGTQVVVVTVLWVALLGGGLVMVWSANRIVAVVILAGLFLLRLMRRSRQAAITARARTIARWYKRIRQHFPDMRQEEALKTTAYAYLKSLGWDERAIPEALEDLLVGWAGVGCAFASAAAIPGGPDRSVEALTWLTGRLLLLEGRSDLIWGRGGDSGAFLHVVSEAWRAELGEESGEPEEP